MIDVSGLFREPAALHHLGAQRDGEATALWAGLLARSRRVGQDDITYVRDSLGHSALSCVTVISPASCRLSAPAGFALSAAPVGGFILAGAEADLPCYWFPLPPRQVQQDPQGHVLRVDAAPLVDLALSPKELVAGFASQADPIEIVVWQLPSPKALQPASALEGSAWYMLGSHTAVRGRVDVYKHLVAGTVYENRLAWPNDWRVFSENDAHALHLTLGGLARATGDLMLQAMRDQVMLAVIERQSEDGGFRHGEWTALMESHYRLHCSAMHLMMDALDERPDDMRLKSALQAAAAFMSRQAVKLSFGHWFLHDELEHSVDKQKLGPFKWVPSALFGKAESNMLVLNSHLDATIALHRYAQLTGDNQYAELVSSARKAATAVLGLRSADGLYRLVFWFVGLTFLPTSAARRLPAWKRALKRVAWKYIIPVLPDLKARFPRLVMPGGYIDREFTLRTFAHDYHAINLMDLARYLRRFDEPVVRQTLVQGLEFTRQSGILLRWQELAYQRYALGFWAEALYHVCTLFSDSRYRQWLGEVMLVLEDLKMGQPPSLLGTNAEAVPVAHQLPCPIPADARLRVANLGRLGAPELLVVNATDAALPLAWDRPAATPMVWRCADGKLAVQHALVVPPRSWLSAHAAH